MNAEANVASGNWEKLLSEIEKHSEHGIMNVDLSDSKADLYDFANTKLMKMMRARLVRYLQRRRYGIFDLSFGNKFFMILSEQKQRHFFHSIFNLPVWVITVGEATDNSTESPAITINTSALLETLPQLHTAVSHLSVNNFALTSQSDVQAMSKIILAKCMTLESLSLKSIQCTVDDLAKQDNNEPAGFLDPLFYAVSGLKAFGVSTQTPSLDAFGVATKTPSVHSTLVSPKAVRALFVEGKRSSVFALRGLGLTDSHVLAIVDGLSTPGSTHLDYMNLKSNPDITDQGYGALWNLINRANVVGIDFEGKWHGFIVDDKAWEGELNLVSEMNLKYHRLEYHLTNGTFTSEERRWQWLERVANLPSCEEGCTDDEKKEWDAKHLNFVWHTLCQNPEMMET